jgi:hypothetical protein
MNFPLPHHHDTYGLSYNCGYNHLVIISHKPVSKGLFNKQFLYAISIYKLPSMPLSSVFNMAYLTLT